jgi:competence protein ComEA
MKKFLNKLLTEDEQKVLLFLLFFAFWGILLNYSGLIAQNDSNVMDSLKTAEDVEIKFDLNTVTAKELTSIPGIGEKRAVDIVNYREINGFSSRSELLNIKGIGEASYKKFENWFYEFENEKNMTFTEEIVEKKNTPDNLKINLNSATEKELCLLKGIGPDKAKKIVLLRETLGRFSDVDELLQIKGIGIKTLEKIRSDIYLGD